MKKTVIIIHKPFIFFLKTVLALLFFFPFYNVNYGYEQLFKIFRSGQKQQTAQSTARADHWKPHENAKSWLVQKWYHTCVDKNSISTGDSGDIIFLILLPFGIQLFHIIIYRHYPRRTTCTHPVQICKV